MEPELTPKCSKVMELADESARLFNHEFVGTEHLLLGLVDEGGGIAIKAMEEMGLSPSDVAAKTRGLCAAGPEEVAPGALPHTPGAKQVLEHARREASHMKHNFVGTEHLLLGLLHVRDGVAAKVLADFGITLDAIREKILGILGFDTKGSV